MERSDGVAAALAGAKGEASDSEGRGAAVAGAAIVPSVTIARAKKKSGRPRKYRPNGSVLAPLNSVPISALPAVGFLSLPRYRTELGSLGEIVTCSGGANFTPHVITVAAGEDVTMKIISFSQQGPRAICILSANGVISNATLRQPDSSGGTLTYEGHFEMLSLSGFFMPNDKGLNGGMRSRSGGMSVSLASPDGNVVGGGVAGVLVAASPVQVVLGSFVLSCQMVQKNKKQKIETISFSTRSPVFPWSNIVTEKVYSGSPVYCSSTTSKSTPVISCFKIENWAPSAHSNLATNNSTDIESYLSVG